MPSLNASHHQNASVLFNHHPRIIERRPCRKKLGKTYDFQEKLVNPNHLAERIQARDLCQSIKGKAVASRDVQKGDTQTED